MSNPETFSLGLMQRIPPALAAGVAHLPALALGALLVTSGMPLQVVLAGVGITAALVAWFWHLPVWWRYINLGFVPLLGLALAFPIDAHWYLAGFILLAATSLGAIRTRVPLFLSSHKAVQAVAERIPPQGRMLDMGCGLGGPMAGIKKQRPDVEVDGVEAAPLNWLLARLRLAGKARVRLGSLWDTDLGDYDVVYAYLSPAPMARLWEKAQTEMRPGSLFISNTFSVPGVPPAEIIELHDLSNARLLIWRL
ncbi:MAG: class I SAM-dependent methyltransferase [Pseudomonadota bacterium]